MDLPDAERPVSQRVRPRWERRVLRSLRERDGCQVMLLGIVLVEGKVELKLRGL